MIEPPAGQKPKKLLEQVREVMRLKHYAYRTEETYLQWIKRYILFHGKRHPKDMGRLEIEAFLTDLAVNQNVAASTQNQALNAVLFPSHKVLGMEIAEPRICWKMVMTFAPFRNFWAIKTLRLQ